MGLLDNVETRLFIGNEFVAGKSGKTFQLVNPATEAPILQIHEADAEDIDAAVQHAKKVQPAWAELDSFERAVALNGLAQLIAENADRFAELESVSMGVPISMYKLQAQSAALWITYYAGLGMDIHGDSSLRTANHVNLILKQPYGIGAVIIPWNAPLILAAAQISAALAAGNAIILKSSEKAPLTCCLLAQLVKKSGLFPPGLVQIVSGMGPTTGAALALHMEIRKIAFIGSVATGRKIKEMAAKSNLKNVTCELGGKSPLIVFEDANLQKAARDAALSIGFNSGQTCAASSRIYAHQSIRPQFIEAFKAAFQALLERAGDPLELTTTQGPQVDIAQFKNIMKFLDDAKADGIKAEIGGGRRGDKGFYIEPTIFIDPPEDHNISKKEIFGPVVVIQSFTEEVDVVDRANDTEYGLYSSVYTKDISRALRIAKKLEAGSVAINCTSPTVGFDLPFGGWKQSGDQGRQWGRAGIEGWLETKTVFINLTA